MTKLKGYLTTHILDTARGCPAGGISITACRLDGDSASRQVLAEAITNSDGRTDAPIIASGDFIAGTYELIFHVGPYIKKHFQNHGEPFFDNIPVVFTNSDGDAHYHVPLLLSPYGYSTYRGS